MNFRVKTPTHLSMQIRDLLTNGEINKAILEASKRIQRLRVNCRTITPRSSQRPFSPAGAPAKQVRFRYSNVVRLEMLVESSQLKNGFVLRCRQPSK